MECEGIAGFGDVHCAEFPGPFEHILKDMAVDCLKLARIEPAFDGLVFKLT
jgi:hypothetical protein